MIGRTLAFVMIGVVGTWGVAFIGSVLLQEHLWAAALAPSLYIVCIVLAASPSWLQGPLPGWKGRVLAFAVITVVLSLVLQGFGVKASRPAVAGLSAGYALFVLAADYALRHAFVEKQR